ncbi:MAG: alpha-ketoacid dehydrogenase subunit beta, partial [Actinomycetota bacterium]|nr:alpha-ketoacid dehydrogenase subunit beta [Actinomycetota bacterium]
MAEKNLLQAIHEGLAEEMRSDETVVVMGEDVGRAGGVFRVTQGLQDEFGPARVMDTPLAESLIVGAAIGLSVNGMRAVAEIQFADFIPPAFDQIVNEAARFYYRSNGAWNVPITIRAPYGVVPGGALYHSQSVEAWFCNTPGLRVAAPTFPADAKAMIRSAIRDPNPVIFFEHKRTYRLIKEDVPDDGEHEVPLGKARVHREGTDLTVVSYGLMLYT